MRMLDAERQQSVRTLQLYLRTTEAKKLRATLDRLLADPEANEHEHILDEDGGWDLSLSLLTDSKLSDMAGYTERERRLFRER